MGEKYNIWRYENLQVVERIQLAFLKIAKPGSSQNFMDAAKTID